MGFLLPVVVLVELGVERLVNNSVDIYDDLVGLGCFKVCVYLIELIWVLCGMMRK